MVASWLKNPWDLALVVAQLDRYTLGLQPARIGLGLAAQDVVLRRHDQRGREVADGGGLHRRGVRLEPLRRVRDVHLPDVTDAIGVPGTELRVACANPEYRCLYASSGHELSTAA